MTVPQRMSLTSAGASACAQIESAVSAGTPSRAASARQARSASESPCAQFATLIAAPSFIASRTVVAPSSSFRCAITAEASRTDAGSAFGTAPSGLGGFGLNPVFGSRFGAPFGDQLVGQAAARSQAGEHAACALDRRSASLDYELGLGLLGDRGLLLGLGSFELDFQRMCHGQILARALDSRRPSS
jgi:hypothetical protein